MNDGFIEKPTFEYILYRFEWDGVSMPVQAKTKRLQKIFPLLVFWSVGLGMIFL
jgi:hypothetical protein